MKLFPLVLLFFAIIETYSPRAVLFAAEPSAETQGHFHHTVSLYSGQGVDENLLNLPWHIVTSRVEWDRTYFTALGLGRVYGRLGQLSEILRNTPLEAFLHGYEIVAVRHHGLQSNAELGGAWMVRAPDLPLGPIGVNFSAGAGVSYAFGTPTYEDGPVDDPARRYRLQLLALFEFEWTIRNCERFSLVNRVHHRSGVYGLIAPQNVGSNFLVIGIRYRF